jgi:N-acetylmuramic acid 6-phosphate etherase
MEETLGTESASNHRNLELQNIDDLLILMNQEDQGVAKAVAGVLPEVGQLVAEIVKRLEAGGRVFYIGAGTSGRLGIIDASECPPTFGVADTLFTGIIAGGDGAIRKAVEGAEDSTTQAWEDLIRENISSSDVVIGIASSGRTPYVVHGLEACREAGIFTACITCNKDTKVAAVSDVAIEVLTGPEFITGSTRLKAGTATKMILNMISTISMIRLGKIQDNLMIDMKLSNQKLMERGIKILVQRMGLSEAEARQKLSKYGSVRMALNEWTA